ncbi:hypothetical protein D5H75_30940, partial [Bailinhaonella thermotolerans]
MTAHDPVTHALGRYPEGVEGVYDTYAGLPVTGISDLGPDGEPPSAADHAWRLWDYLEYGAKDGVAESVRRFFGEVDTRRVRAVVVPEYTGRGGSLGDAVRLLAEHADDLPELRAVFLGAVRGDMYQISWIEHGDVTPLLEAFPKLERLEVCGNSQEGLRLRPVRHDALRMLRFESGG